ncbi:MAG: hypothetical protein L0206_01165 [Actinobacteria bacterium]|nr:hypothetical protein [Actinomycetota bacterium]
MLTYRDRHTGREHRRQAPSPLLDNSPRYELVDDEPDLELEPDLGETDHDQEGT